MQLETWVQIGALLTVAGTVWRASLKVQSKFTTLENKVEEVAVAQIAAVSERKELQQTFLRMHGHHYNHAKETEIHQIAMSRETSEVHFESITRQLTANSDALTKHADEDMGVIRDIRNTLQAVNKSILEISTRVPRPQLPIPD